MRGRRLVRVLAPVILLVLTPRASGEPTPVAPPRERAFVVAIDPGHGGSNLGAAGLAAGVYEKNVTLALALRVRARLAGASGVRVVLCRDQDVLVPIRARARCARDVAADLFVSLHANAVAPGIPAGSQRGFEVYVLSPREVEEDAALANVASASDADAAWAAHRVRAAAEGAALAAGVIERRLKQALGTQASRGIRQTGAALDVLRGTSVPGVLVEVGFIDHREEGRVLASPEGQDRLAAALADAIAAVRDELRPEAPR